MDFKQKHFKKRWQRHSISVVLVMAMLVTSVTANTFSVVNVRAAGYDAQAAINYARQYANSRNPQYANYGDNDCSNFVSQCLTAGGLQHDSVWNPNAGTDPQTGYNDWRTTALKDYLINKGYTVIWNPSANQILPGNPVFYSTRSDYATSHTGTNHAAICVSNVNGNNPLICAHSTNRLDYPHSYMMSYYKGCCTILLNTASSTSSTPSTNPGAPYPIPTGILQSGSTGDAVRWVQACVNALLGAGIGVDGQYGNQTIYAVKQFQERNGLTVDGIVGNATTNKMLEVWRNSLDNTKPVVSNVRVTDISLEGYRVTCTVSDNKGVTKVKFPTWTYKNGQDDLIWHDGAISGNTATFYVKRTEHKGEYGVYTTHIYAYDAANNEGFATAGDIRLSQLNEKKNIGTGFYAMIKNVGGTVLTNTSEVSSLNSSARNIKCYNETGMDNQLWYFEKIGTDATYRIRSKADGRYMDNWGGKDVSGNTVVADLSKDTTEQRWNLYDAGNSLYFICPNCCENTLLDLVNASSDQGTNIWVYEINKSSAQQFYIQKYYQVTFKNGNSTVKTQFVKSGTSAVAPTITKNGYTLSWDKHYNNVTGDITVNAVWTYNSQQGDNDSAAMKSPMPSKSPTDIETPAVTKQPAGAASLGATGTPAPTNTPNPTKKPSTTKEPTYSSSYDDTDDEEATVTLEKKVLHIKRGKKLRIKIKRKAAWDYVVRYQIVGKKKIVKVSRKGVVKGVRKGKTNVKVIMASGATAKCKVIVKQRR